MSVSISSDFASSVMKVMMILGFRRGLQTQIDSGGMHTL